VAFLHAEAQAVLPNFAARVYNLEHV
jgi:hypothetical protein